MMESDASVRELLRLAEECCADTIDDDGLARIDELLCEQPERFEAYSQYLAVHVSLRRVLSNAVDPRTLGIGSLEAPTGSSPADWVERALMSPPRRHSALLRAASVTLVATLFYGSFALLALNIRQENDRDQNRPRLAAATAEAEIVSTVTAAIGCQWRMGSTESRPSVGTQLRANDEFELLSGALELTFADQATVVLEAPARFTVQEAGQGMLQNGRLIARVPPQAVGFTIETPTVRVVDLGTEFGVDTSASGDTEVKVFRGRVRVHRLRSASKSPDAQFTLTAGQAKRVAASGEVVATRAEATGAWRLLAERFARKPRVFPDSLIAYWDFDEPAGRTVSDQRDDYHGKLNTGNRVGGLAGRGALRFGNGGERVQIPFDNDVISFSEELTIEAALVSSWSGKPHDIDYIFRKQDNRISTISLCLTHAIHGSGTRPVLSFAVNTDRGVQAVQMPFDGQEGRPTLQEFTDGRVHCVAAAFNGKEGQMSLFLDGVLRMRGNLDRNTSLARGGDSVDQQDRRRLATDSLNGVLDEVAIYRTALSDEEVLRHWNNLIQGRSFFEN